MDGVMIMKRILIYIISILVIGLSNIYSVEGKIRLAILDLDPVGVDQITALTVSDLLRTELFNTGLFMVIERQEMTSILKEQEYQMSGCTSTECAVQIGKLLSANKILVGTVNKLGKSFIINARIVNVEKGTMEFGDKAKVSSLDELDKGCEIFARKLAARIRGAKIIEEEDSQPQKTQERFGKNRCRDRQRHGHNDRPHRIRDQMTEKDSPSTCAKRSGSENEILVFNL